jgi:hypothetical protein
VQQVQHGARRLGTQRIDHFRDRRRIVRIPVRGGLGQQQMVLDEGADRLHVRLGDAQPGQPGRDHLCTDGGVVTG